jgi:uncharacterized integral membrane protein
MNVAQRKGCGTMIYVIIMCLVSLCVALFAVQNSMAVAVTFLAWNFITSLVMVILSSFAAGLLIAFCWGLKLKTQHYLHERKRQEQVAHLEEEKNKLQEEIAMLMHTQKQRLAVQNAKESAVSAVKLSGLSESPTFPRFNPKK